MSDVTPQTVIRCDWIEPDEDDRVDGQCQTKATFTRSAFSPELPELMMQWWFTDDRHFCPEHKRIARANLAR